MIVNFQGYHYGQSSSFPDKSGIYCVYSMHNGKLIYIGQAENLRQRITNHDRWQDFLKHRISPVTDLVTTYALLPIGDMDKAEGRLIAKNRPPENEKIPLAYYQGPMELIGDYVWGLRT